MRFTIELSSAARAIAFVTRGGFALILLAMLSGLARPPEAHAQFTSITKNPLGDNGMAFGVSWVDPDADGDQDLYITNDGSNLLLRNNGGGNFADATVPPLDDAGNGGSAVWGDYDNDGDLDVYLVNYLTANRLFRNDGGGVFADATTAPLGDTGAGQGAAWADYDLDGDLDLYLVNYGTPNKLFRNEGNGTFVDATAGPLADAGWGLACTWGDYDNDGDPDLYVTNDGPNRLLRNDGGVFTRVTGLAIEDGNAGQGAAWGDYDNDGDLDLYVANYGTANKLIRNDGADHFTQITTGALGDLGNGTGVAWGDFDNDGDLDLYLANYGTANRLLRNDGANVFTALTSGPLGDNGNGTGVAWADYDGDGDLDLYLANDGSSNILMRNDLANGNHWLELDLVGLVSNRSAIGARVRVVAGGLHQIQEVSGGSGYLSQNSLTLEFGLGAAAVADSVIVAWPSGYVETYLAVPADQRLTITELTVVAVGESPAPGPPLALAPPWPNPTAGTAAFRLTLPRASSVRLSVYDVQGRCVATPVRGRFGAGWHPCTWNGRDSRGRRVAAGIYFARLEALGEVRTQRLVVLR